MTEAVKNVNHIIASQFTGSYMNKSWLDMIKREPVKQDTAEEIITRIKRKLHDIGEQ